MYAGGIWKCDVLVADIEELETMNASEIFSKRLNAKEVIFPKENEHSIFLVADGRIKLRWRRSGTENIHLDTGSPNVRGLFSAIMPDSSLTEVRMVLVLHMEDEDDQENEKEDEREDGKQRVEGRVVESQATHNMQMTHEMKCADNQT